MFLAVVLLALAFSPKFRAWYGRMAPVLFTVTKLLFVIVTGCWLCGAAYVAYSSPYTLRTPGFWAMVGGTYGALTSLIWVDGPVFIGGVGLAFRFLRGVWPLVSKILVAVTGLTFLGLTVWARSLPVLRGSQWSLKDMIIRAGAIVSGVVFVLVLLGMLLPPILNRLERTGFASFVAARHVRSEKSNFLTVISILAICGVSISSCSLSSVVSVMGGFSQDLKRKILGNNAHVIVDQASQAGWADYEQTLAKVRKAPHVIAATPIVQGEVMMSSPANMAGVIVKGIEPGSIRQVIDLGVNIDVGRFEYLESPDKLLHMAPTEIIGTGPGGEQYMKGPDLLGHDDDREPAIRAFMPPKVPRPGIIVGRELAKTLHVYVGDEITLVSPLGDLGPMGIMPRTKKFRVAAIFFSGMYEYDASHAYTVLGEAQDYFSQQGKITRIDVKVDDADKADLIAPTLGPLVGRSELRIRDWREMNRNLFSALKLERFATFIILSIAIMVASFCIICTLLLMVTEKGKEIAILKAVGASDASILKTFMLEGMVIGGIGTTFGVAAGLAVCMGLSWFGLRLDPDVYYIDRLPIAVNGWDFLAVAGSALAICTLATVYPALVAARLRPVDGLRYE